MDCSPPGSYFHGILQAWILEWVAIPFSRGSSWPRDGNQVFCPAGEFFSIWVSREALCKEVCLLAVPMLTSHVVPVVKTLPASTGDARDVGLVPGWGRFPGVGNSNPFQYSCLENSMDRGTWRVTVHGLAKSRPRLSTSAQHQSKQMKNAEYF